MEEKYIYQKHIYHVDTESGTRADIYLSRNSDLGSRSQIKNRIRKLQINGQDAKLSQNVENGDHIELHMEALPQFDLEPEKMQAEILFENDDVIVVNKPAGMVVHPAKGNYTGTLLHGLLGHISKLRDDFMETATDDIESFRPGIVHRLDKDTSGVIIAAKHPEAHAFLVNEFAERRVGKLYTAIVKGTPRKQTDSIKTRIIRDPANRKRFTTVDSSRLGKDSHTIYRLVQTVKKGTRDFSLLSLYPCTGRTHQLRVHMKFIGCSILGDPVYGRCGQEAAETGLMLHATLLSIRLPGGSGEQTFFAPIPERFRCFETPDHTIPADMDWFESQLQSLRAAPEQGKS
ncbi:RluA family pseudouridine synthase [Spirochaeta dissipatitropha]